MFRNISRRFKKVADVSKHLQLFFCLFSGKRTSRRWVELLRTTPGKPQKNAIFRRTFDPAAGSGEDLAEI
jgi:hypothetical protein